MLATKCAASVATQNETSGTSTCKKMKISLSLIIFDKTNIAYHKLFSRVLK